MKSLTQSLLIGALAMTCAMPLSLNAQEKAKPEGKQSQGRKGEARMMSPEDRADRLGQMLGLSEEQTSAVTQILQSNREKMETQRKSGERPSRESMQAMRETTATAINDILTAEQKARFDEIRAQHAEKKGEPGQRGQRHQRPARPNQSENGSV